MAEIFGWYIIANIAFLITSYFTFHFPSWKIAMYWARENLKPEFVPTGKLIFGHTVIYSVLALIAFPILAVSIIFSNESSIRGYTKSLIEMIQRNAEDAT